MSLADRDSAALWHPYTQMQTATPPLVVTRGEGVYLYTEDGRKILDGISSWWVNIHGHSHPKLNEAIAKQARELEHVIFAGCTHRPAVELAERLLEVLPPGIARVFYSDNGSTAVEVALKMAFQYWRNIGQPERDTFITLTNAYHGDTVGAMSASEDSVFTQAFRPLLFRVERAGNLAEIESKLSKLGGCAAGVLIEPILQGAGGMIVWPAEFVAGVRRLCDLNGTLMIADEVLTGFGRTGRMFACDHASVTPDIICLAKALTGGYLPLGATAVTSRIYEAFLSDDRAKTFFHGHSFTANPLACAVAIASLDLFREEPVMQRVAALEQRLRAGLEPLRKLTCVRDVRVIGGVGIVELCGAGPRPEAGSQPASDLFETTPRQRRPERPPQAEGLPHGYLDNLGPRLSAEFLRRDLLLRPLGNVLYFMPPYAIGESETYHALDQISQVLQTFPLC